MQLSAYEGCGLWATKDDTLAAQNHQETVARTHIVADHFVAAAMPCRGSLETEAFNAVRRRYIEHNTTGTSDGPLFPFTDFVAGIAPGSALDLAAADGALALSLAGSGWRCDGVEMIESAAQLARLSVQQAGFDDVVSIAVANWLDYAPPRRAYDLAFDIGALQAFPAAYHDAYLSKLARVMRPGGHVVLYVRFDTPADPSVAAYTTPALLAAAIEPRFTVLERLATSAQHGMRLLPAVWLLLRA